MKADIEWDPSIHGTFNDKAFWTPTNVIGSEILTISHVLPSFLVLAFGLVSSVIAYVLEKVSCQSDDNVKPTLQHSNMDSSKGTDKSREESTIEMLTDEATMEPNEENSPKLDSGVIKEPNVAMEKDGEDKIRTSVEIHEELCKEESTMGNAQNEPFTVSVTPIIGEDNKKMDRIGTCQNVLKKDDTEIMEDKTMLNYNLSGEGSPIRYSPQSSEIIDYLDNEESTTGQFLDEEASTTQTSEVSPGLDIPNNVDSSRASSQGSAVIEEDDTKSILGMIEIHETPVRGMSG